MIFDEKYKNYSDNELISSFSISGEAFFIGILYERYGHLVLGLSMKYLKNKVEAHDAVVQIFMDLTTDLRKHKVEYFKSWLYTYSKNFCLMELRKRQSALKKELELKDNAHLIMDFSDPVHLEEKEKQISHLEYAIEQLNPGQKICIHLFYIENKSYTEIVSITGFSSNDVKSHIQNGKRNLKLTLEALMNGQEDK